MNDQKKKLAMMGWKIIYCKERVERKFNETDSLSVKKHTYNLYNLAYIISIKL